MLSRVPAAGVHDSAAHRISTAMIWQRLRETFVGLALRACFALGARCNGAYGLQARNVFVRGGCAIKSDSKLVKTCCCDLMIVVL